MTTTLYISTGACSFASHVVVHELDLPIQVERVALRTADSPIHQINPLGRVPVLQLDDGRIITENSAILPFLADLKPATTLFAPVGSVERAQIQSWIGYLASEVHVGGFRPLNRPERYSADESAHPGIRAQAVEQLYAAFAHIDRHLQNTPFLVAERYTIADAYLGVFAGWAGRVGGRLDELQALAKFREAFKERPAVKQALVAEGF
jgi:glutathione S-transferase